MGLFAHENGHLRGWLAALLCCWAAMGDDETCGEVKKKRRRRRTTKASDTKSVMVCSDQPMLVQPMSLNATRSLSAASDESSRDKGCVGPMSERPPALKPLELGEMSLNRMGLHVRRKSSTNLLWTSKGVSIGPPKDLRKLDCTEKQHRSLKPLPLEPVVLQGTENELPSDGVVLAQCALPPSDVDTDVETVHRHSYRDSRESPWQRCQQMSAIARARESLHGLPQVEGRKSEKKQRRSRPPLSTRSSTSSIRSFCRQVVEASASGAAMYTSRASGERMSLHRKCSNQSMRTSPPGAKTLDQEILELNTIVKERRAESGRGQSQDDLHVPAVAPKMGLRARSETLTDIGSAFSRPLRSGPDCPATLEAVSPPKSPARFRLSQPSNDMPEPNPTAIEADGVKRPHSRVSGWLSNMFSTSAASTAECVDATPPTLYSLRRRAVSTSSLCSTVTELESPYLTATSSPTTQGHCRDRSLLSPPSTACTSDIDARSTWRKPTEPWVSPARPSAVGLAL